MAAELEGRVAIVTGGSRGIGLACARALSDRGATVVLTSRRQEAADQAALEIGAGAVGIAAHAVDEEAASRCVRLAVERFGRLDILVNNAGTNPAFGPLVEQDEARFMKTFEVNAWAPVLWTGIAWREWMGANDGTVINTASVGGLAPSHDLGAYNASKAALIHITRQLALELAPRVRVNAVAPGIVKTKLSQALWAEQEDTVVAATPLARLGQPEDVARAIAFLASDDSSWVTGETVVIDGGQLMMGLAS